MACPICGAATSGLCQQCELEERLERDDRELRELEESVDD